MAGADTNTARQQEPHPARRPVFLEGSTHMKMRRESRLHVHPQPNHLTENQVPKSELIAEVVVHLFDNNHQRLVCCLAFAKILVIAQSTGLRSETCSNLKYFLTFG